MYGTAFKAFLWYGRFNFTLAWQCTNLAPVGWTPPRFVVEILMNLGELLTTETVVDFDPSSFTHGRLERLIARDVLLRYNECVIKGEFQQSGEGVRDSQEKSY